MPQLAQQAELEPLVALKNESENSNVALEESGGKPKGSEPVLRAAGRAPGQAHKLQIAALKGRAPWNSLAPIPSPAVWLAGYQKS